MPYIDLYTQPAPNAGQAAVLARGITEAMTEVAGKRREVTAVRIAAADTALWTIGASPCPNTTAYLEVRVTAGTSTYEEKRALIERLHHLLVDTFGELAEASYIVIQELPAENWGYAGRTQAARAAESA